MFLFSLIVILSTLLVILVCGDLLERCFVFLILNYIIRDLMVSSKQQAFFVPIFPDSDLRNVAGYTGYHTPEALMTFLSRKGRGTEHRRAAFVSSDATVPKDSRSSSSRTPKLSQEARQSLQLLVE